MPAMTMTEKILARHAGKPISRARRQRLGRCRHPHDARRVRTGHHRRLQAALRQGRQGLGPREGRHHPRPLHLHRRRDGQPQRRRPARSSWPSRICRTIYDVGTDRYKGVCHIALPEEGHTRPGEVLFGTDSHTCTAGAFGEFATGIGNTDAGFVMGTGKLWVKVPPTMRFVFHGEMPPYLMAKDLILAVIGDIGCDGATYRAMEFDGDGVYRPQHRRTHDAVQHGHRGRRQERRHRPGPGHARLRQRPQQAGKKPYEVVKTDAGAKFCFEKVYDVTKLEPVVAKPHSPDNQAHVVRGEGHEARPRLHRLLHRRQDDRLPRRRRASSRASTVQDRHVRRAGDERDRRRA